MLTWCCILLCCRYIQTHKYDEDWIARKIVHMEKKLYDTTMCQCIEKLYCIVLYSGEWKIYWRCICMCRSLYGQFRVYYLVTNTVSGLHNSDSMLVCALSPVYTSCCCEIDLEDYWSSCLLVWKIQIACYMAVVGGCMPAWCVCTSWGTIYL